MPRISLLAPSLNLQEGAGGDQRGDARGDQPPPSLEGPPTGSPPPRASPLEQELDPHQGSVLPQARPCRRREQDPQGRSGGWAHSVLEARLVSSCLSLPSSASPRFSRLLARKGVRV